MYNLEKMLFLTLYVTVMAMKQFQEKNKDIIKFSLLYTVSFVTRTLHIFRLNIQLILLIIIITNNKKFSVDIAYLYKQLKFTHSFHTCHIVVHKDDLEIHIYIPIYRVDIFM